MNNLFYNTTVQNEVKFSGTPANEIRQRAIIKLKRRRCHMLSLVLLIPLAMIFYCFGMIIFSGIADGVENELKKELWLDPARIESYYDVYVRSDWYVSTVSDCDLDPYDIKNAVFRWSQIKEAFAVEFGEEAVFSPDTVHTPPDSLEVFTGKIQQKVDETRARLTEEYRGRTILLHCLAVLFVACAAAAAYVMVFPPIVRRMKNSTLIVCEGKRIGFVYYRRWYRLSAVLKNSENDVVSVRIDDCELPIGERMAFRNEKDKRVLAVRIENDTRRHPRPEVFPLARIEKIEERMQ